MKRRTFIKGVFAAGALSFANLSDIYGKSAPSNKIKVALIGCGNMGWSNLSIFLDYPEVECVALCDADNERLDKRAADVYEKSGLKPLKFKDWRRIIDNKNVDLVIIATPDHWHCLQMVYACQAGKDVYVEKPLAHTVQECNLMEAAASKYNRVVQVGQWQRSDPHRAEAVEFATSARLGRIRNIRAWSYQDDVSALPRIPDEPVPQGVDYEMWLGPALKRPFNKNRFHHNFRFFWDYSGGLMSERGVHLLDCALETMNAEMPEYVAGLGGKYAYPCDATETPDTLTVVYKYPEFNLIWEHACGVNHGLFGIKEGVAFYGETGTMLLTCDGWEVFPVNGRMKAVPFKKDQGKGLYNHVGNTLECVRTRKTPNADVKAGSRAAKLCHIGNISTRVGRALLWNNNTGRFADNGEANDYINAYYRAPWNLPEIK